MVEGNALAMVLASIPMDEYVEVDVEEKDAVTTGLCDVNVSGISRASMPVENERVEVSSIVRGVHNRTDRKKKQKPKDFVSPKTTRRDMRRSKGKRDMEAKGKVSH